MAHGFVNSPGSSGVDVEELAQGGGFTSEAELLGALGSMRRALLYGEENGEAGRFDSLTAAPTAEVPLRYNGILRATKVFGVYFSDNADLAERYPVEGPWEPGDLIRICPDGSLRRNDVPFNRMVLGFVSTAPGCVLGEGTQGPPVALCGRVPVKVVGPVWPGDYLEAAEEPGCVQRVEPDHALRGAIVGQALEKKTASGPELVMALVLRM